MARNKKTSKLKEPIRLRMKDLSNGNKSLYLDIYRDGKRSYEYLKMYIIPETDDDARWKSHATLTLLATQDLPTFGYNMIDPLKSWC